MKEPHSTPSKAFSASSDISASGAVEVDGLYIVLNKRLKLKKECLFLIKPVWSGEITDGSVDSRREAKSFDSSLKSTFNRLIGQYEAQDRGSLFFFNIREMEAWVRVWGNLRYSNDSLYISIKMGDNLCKNFR